MTARPAALLAATLMVAVVAAGCLDARANKDYYAGGRDGWFSLGYAYDGQGVLPFKGPVVIHAVERDNTGLALVKGTLNGKEWAIRLDEFAEQSGKPFQDGGIAANLVEHGDSGHGDASLPTIHADMAAWGEASVTTDGQPVPDPLTGEALWVAHYMVVTTGVRDNATHQIWNADHSKPYDPKAPADAHVEEGDFEIHVSLKSHATAAGNATAVDLQETSSPTTAAQYSVEKPLVDNAVTGAQANLTLTLTPTTGGQGQLTFSFLGPAGKEVARKQLSVAPLRPNAATATVAFALNETGAYKLRVSGEMIDAQWTVKGAVSPPANVLLNFWWEDVVFGQAAKTLFAQTTGSEATPVDAGASAGPAEAHL